ncbi:hypothetical protein JCM10207_002270 [Rhodosporidiobolus poonsookiae]
MRLNEATALVNDRVVLRPYRRWHVPRYNEWMQDAQMQELTASEPLSLDEEYEMQRSWRLDNDKLTFIVHLREPDAPSPSTDRTAFLAAHNDGSTMIGDVNLFLHDVTPPSSPSSPSVASAPPTTPAAPAFSRRAEMEIMFPPLPPFPARSGIALATLQLFLSYASRALALPPAAFFARIGFDNAPSLALFAKLGFEEGKRVEVFREVEIVWRKGGQRWPWEEKEGWTIEQVVDSRDEERD